MLYGSDSGAPGRMKQGTLMSLLSLALDDNALIRFWKSAIDLKIDSFG
jgi:hypothetical protein